MARPVLSEKIPGAAASTGTLSVLAANPLTLTTICAVPGRVSHGTWKFTWLAVTARIGAGRPLTVIETPPRLLGSGAPAVASDAARCVPNKVANEPGEICDV